MRLFDYSKNADEKIKDYYSYKDIRSGRTYYMSCQSEGSGDIVVDTGCGTETYGKRDSLLLPVFSEIAAGTPILMDDTVEGTFRLPKPWIRSSQDYFILKVKGDSMENADINDGDYVVIRKQSSVDNMNIAAVDIDGEATLKKFSRKGSKILLLPENSKYEPITLKDEQVRIIGLAVGVLKKGIEE